MPHDRYENRVEHDLALAFGDVTRDRKGSNWIFIGWRHNTAGAFPVFVEEQLGQLAVGAWAVNSVHMYTCSFTATLLNKFPDLERKRKPCSR